MLPQHKPCIPPWLPVPVPLLAHVPVPVPVPVPAPVPALVSTHLPSSFTPFSRKLLVY